MSIQAVAWVLAQPAEDLPGTARLIMLALANHADHTTGHCWPSQETIAKEAGCNERTVQRYLPALVRNGFIDKRSRRGKNGQVRSNDYWMLFERKPGPFQYFNGGKDEPPDNLSDGLTAEIETSHTTLESDGPYDTGVVRQIMLEPSVIEPSGAPPDDRPASGEAPPPAPQPPAQADKPKAAERTKPNGFDPDKRKSEQDRLNAADDARRPQSYPVIRGSEPWNAWVKAGHPDTLFTQVTMPGGRRDFGWYFRTLWPPPETGPPPAKSA